MGAKTHRVSERKMPGRIKNVSIWKTGRLRRGRKLCNYFSNNHFEQAVQWHYSAYRVTFGFILDLVYFQSVCYINSIGY
jgi:hypothetical protein